MPLTRPFGTRYGNSGLYKGAMMFIRSLFSQEVVLKVLSLQHIQPSGPTFIAKSIFGEVVCSALFQRRLARLVEGNLSRAVILMNYDKPFACQAEVPAFLL